MDHSVRSVQSLPTSLNLALKGDLNPLLTFQTSPATSTAFLTVTITQKVPDWLSPGNYDPLVAFHFSQVVFKAIDRTLLLRDRIELRKRAERLFRQGEKMRPRGNRVPWWENPDLGAEVNATSVDTGNGTVTIILPDSVASGADTASANRRRRT